MILRRLHRLLDHPWMYRLVQGVFAPGAVDRSVQVIRDLLPALPSAGPLLDVGCGPSSRLCRMGLRPTGVDLSWTYLREYVRQGRRGVVGSADALPFASGAFGGVWSIGLLHHLPDLRARAVLREYMRVCAPRGYVAILEGVKPVSPWERPVAAFIRKMDRGRYMRVQEHFEALLPERPRWNVLRFTCAPRTGLEMVVAWWIRVRRLGEEGQPDA